MVFTINLPSWDLKNLAPLFPEESSYTGADDTNEFYKKNEEKEKRGLLDIIFYYLFKKLVINIIQIFKKNWQCSSILDIIFFLSSEF